MGPRVLGAATVSLYSDLVAAEVRQPVAIRVTRPYANEDEFLDHEIDTLTRTSVTLIGAQSRPQGVILRFEVTLANGTPLMRGEGRVIAYKGPTDPEAGVPLKHLSGLTLRFTRLDKKTKALVDRAALIREERARAALRASMSDMSESELPPPPAEAPEAVEPAASNPDVTQADSVHSLSGLEVAQREPEPTPPAPAVEEEPPASNGQPAPIAHARDRDSLLLRLRERARALAPETVAAILRSHTSTHTSTQE
ncbi:hypothetical protein LZC95_15355 [Pendulispora brunnea]|uniref:Uncharacterized protein n=1 Tax=Pendulispora brunnea TaxID=2905690 RepID=A0ABZ2KHP0_9BACT